MSEAMGTQDTAAWAASVVAARRGLHMTQDHLAQAAGVSLSGVRRAERSGFVGPETIRALCAALNIAAPRAIPLAAQPTPAAQPTQDTQQGSKMRAMLAKSRELVGPFIKRCLGRAIGVVLGCLILFWVGMQVNFYFFTPRLVAHSLSTTFKIKTDMLVAQDVHSMIVSGSEVLEDPSMNPDEAVRQGISEKHVPYLFLSSKQNDTAPWFAPIFSFSVKAPSSRLMADWEAIMQPGFDGFGASLIAQNIVPHIEGLTPQTVWLSIGPISASTCRYAINSLTSVKPIIMAVAFGQGRAWPIQGWAPVSDHDQAIQACSAPVGTLHILLTKNPDVLQGRGQDIPRPLVWPEKETR